MPRKKPQQYPTRVNDVCLTERARLRSAGVDLQSSPLPGEPSELSTCLPASVSQDEVRSISEVLNRSLDAPLSLGTGPSSATVEWVVQSKEDILRDAKRCVQERKPWREEVDDASLERRRLSDRQDRVDRGYLIILPDNRVRSMDTQLSRRVRAQLFNEEEVPEAPQLGAPAQRRQEENKPRGPKRMRNPWYLPASSWYANTARKDPGKRESGRFPYDTLLRGEDGPPSTAPAAEDQETAGLTQRDKETLQIVEAYRQHMKGSRLPHFLQ